MNRESLLQPPSSAAAGTVDAAALATLTSTNAVDWLDPAVYGTWRRLLRLEGGSTDLTASGDATYTVTDSDGRSVDLTSEDTATADALTTGRITLSGGARSVKIYLDLSTLTGWDPRKRTWIAVRLYNVTLATDLDRFRAEAVDSGAANRIAASSLKRYSASDYGFQSMFSDGGFDMDEFQGLASDASGNHWLVLELYPETTKTRGDLTTSSALPTGPEGSTYRATQHHDTRGQRTTEVTVDTWTGLLRIVLQIYGAGESTADFDVHVMQEGT